MLSTACPLLAMAYPPGATVGGTVRGGVAREWTHPDGVRARHPGPTALGAHVRGDHGREGDGSGDEEAMLHSLPDDAETERLVLEVLAVLGPRLCPVPERLVGHCLARARRPLTVGDLADGVAVHRRTLGNWTRCAGLPAPAALISWCRLLTAAYLLRDRGRSVEEVALALDFGSGTALRSMLRRYTGLRTGEVRTQGGHLCVARLLRLRLDRSAGAPRLVES